MSKVGIIRYPGSNCDIETLDYFKDIFEHDNSSFYIWHNCDDVDILKDVKLLVLPGGFAFGDRIYDKATEEYKISPGTMALKSPVNKIILKAVELSIPILGICNGFQILTQMGLLPGKLVLNDCETFVCKKEKCIVNYNNKLTNIDLCIANSYGKYISDNGFMNLRYHPFIIYENGGIGGVCDLEKKIFGMMPHPERNNYNFKHLLIEMLFDNEFLTSQFKFDKCIHDLMFSEHISYKTTRKYLKSMHTNEDWVVQGPGENAGIVDIGKSNDGTEYCIAIRIESHNHPTYINPFEGAATGVGGILRDIFTMGARPIGILDFLRFGTSMHSKDLFEQAIQGISYYGNCVGVPNIGGDYRVHESYNTNPLVNVACLGIVKKENIVYGHAKSEDTYLVYVGSKTGNEGINGAAMASNTFKDSSITEELKSNVQKSDPFLEKLLLEACCEISEAKLIDGMQDMGAGGLLCASLELVKRGQIYIDEWMVVNMGCSINLDKVPTKYKMENHNILISESQERMLLICKEENFKKIGEIFEKWDLEYSIVGKTDRSGKYSVYYNNCLLYEKNIDSFNDIHDYSNTPVNKITTKTDNSEKVKAMEKWQIYDSTVGNRTLKGPDKPGSFSVLNIPEVGKQLILTWGESFKECHEIMKNFENVKPLCIVNCLNYGDPKFSLYDFKEDVHDLNKNCLNHHIPIVGGNVSLYNTTGDKSIIPTPILVMMGISL
mgnify:CR=1 FL=1